MLEGRRIDSLTKADVDALVANEVREGRTLDYKRELPGRSDAARKEFLRDVASFANAAGGYILYGVAERLDDAGAATGIPDVAAGLVGINVDEEVRRLDQMALNGIDPRVPGVRMRAIEGFVHGPVLALQIPRSWAAPHMVALNRDSRFYSRTNAGKYPLDVREIGIAFLRRGGLGGDIRRFRDERLGRIVADDTPVPLLGEPRVVLHLVPLSSLDAERAVDLTAWESSKLPPLSPGGGWNHRFGIDGFTTWSGPQDGPKRSYALVTRVGAIEAVAAEASSRSKEKIFNPAGVEEAVVSGLRTYLAVLRENGVDLPIVVLLSVLGVAGYEAPRTHRFHVRSEPNYRDALLLPDALLESSDIDLASVMRPTFDALWQAFGLPRSLGYADDGRWQAGFRW